MATNVKPLMALEFPQAELHQLGLYLVTSPAFTYATTSATTVINLPANTLLVSLGVKIDTAWAGLGFGDHIDITDGTNNLMTISSLQLASTTNPYGMLCLRNFTSATTIQVNPTDIDSTVSAGQLTVYAIYRMQSGAQDLYQHT